MFLQILAKLDDELVTSIPNREQSVVTKSSHINVEKYTCNII